MNWPTPQDYQDAVQSPRLCFCDPELQSGTPTLDGLGLPRPITGNFASVYEIDCGGRRWAVRCFLRPVDDQQHRYHAISEALATAQLPCMVGFKYLPEGIRIRGQWYPVLKMEWVDGQPLNHFLPRHLSEPRTLRSLAWQWIELNASLRRSGIAHGDLQHGNILVCDGLIKLIDYDGMYVPTLRGLQSNENGHRNYQHPARTPADFGPHLDHFSAWLIFTALCALAADPRLWDQLGGDEHILFRRKDLDRPADSRAFRALEATGEAQLTELAALLRTILDQPLTAIPPLEGGTVRRKPRKALLLPAWQVTPELEARAPLIELAADAAPPAPSADALLRGLISGPPPVAWNPGDLRVERKWAAVALIGAAAVMTAGVAGVLGPVPAMGAGAAALAAPLLVCLLRYRKRVPVAERRALHRRFIASLRARQRGRIAVRRAGRRASSSERRRQQLLARRKALPQECERALQEFERRTDRFLRHIRGRRAELARAEAQLPQAATVAGQKLDRVLDKLARKRAQIARDQQMETREALEQTRARHISDSLAGTSIDESDLPRQLRIRAHTVGVFTAAQVDARRLAQVPQIGRAGAEQLRRWRESIIRAAREVDVHCLADDDVRRVEAKFSALRDALEKQVGDARLAQQRTRQNALLQIGAERDELDEQELDLRDGFAKQVKAIEDRFHQEHLDVTAELEQLALACAEGQVDPELAALQRTLTGRELDVFHLRQELERYQTISFWRFLVQIFRPAGPGGAPAGETGVGVVLEREA